MTQKRRRFSAEFKARVVRAALREAKTLAQLASAFDNIMVERLWRTVKYEDVYIRDYKNPAEARFGLGRYFEYYNRRRRHRSLGRKTPAVVYGLAKKKGFGMIKTDGRRSAVDAALASVALTQSRLTGIRREQFHLNLKVFLSRLWGQP